MILLAFIRPMQKPNATVEAKGPIDDLLHANPMAGWVISGVAILIIVLVGYYMINFFRRWIREDPDNDPVQKLSELEQLKSTAYMTEEEKKRLNTIADFGMLSPSGPLDPELAEFRKIKQMRMPNGDLPDEPQFEEIDDQPEQ